ncbi:MAG: hypothetical protein K2Q01_08550, partial [Rickettsiales bacterium]|nr:hypothetical protein [Rickettsiales bacterium]
FVTAKRALPWIVVTGKHTRTPRSFLQAMEDKNVDKVALFANDKAYGEHYLVAESFKMTKPETVMLKEKQRNGKLMHYMQDIMEKDPQAMLVNTDEVGRKKLHANSPGLEEGNVSYLAYAGDGKEKNRVLTVYNTERMTSFMEKGLMNPHASFVEGLKHRPATVPFDISRRVAEILKQTSAAPVGLGA